MVFCAISGEPPQEPVISVKSGHIYERRLIKKYIAENATDPITGDKLEESDLVELNVCSCSLWLDIVQGELTRFSTKNCATSAASTYFPTCSPPHSAERIRCNRSGAFLVKAEV